jgi:hypothetical protein
MFDKKQYWQNRKEGKRGQGDAYDPYKNTVQHLDDHGISNKPVSKKAVLKNTKRARKAHNVI